MTQPRIFFIGFCAIISQLCLGQDIYFEDFEDSDGGWTTNGTNWTRDSASFTGNTTQHFRLTDFNNYVNDKNARLISPTIDLSGQMDMTLSFTIRYNTQADMDGIRVQYSSTGAKPWTVLGTVGDGQNWYNDSDVDAFNDKVGWSGDNSSWERVSIPLPSALDYSSTAKFRIQFKSDASVTDVGVAVDNFRIRGEQSIAGISGLSLWLKASDGVYENVSGTDEAEDGDIVTYWNDNIAVNDAISDGTGGTAPTYRANAINSNPAIEFFDDGSSHLQTLRYEVIDDMTVLAVYLTNQKEDNGNFWNSPALVGCEASGQTGDYALAITDGQPFFKSTDGDEYGAISPTDYSDGDVHIAIGTRTKSATGHQTIHIDGFQEDSTVSADVSVTDPDHVGIGNMQDIQASAQFDGLIAEIVIFNTALSDADRGNVESYLAIKYGVTLVPEDTSSGGCVDYTSSSSTIFYPSCSSHSDYNNDVVGIGRDDDFDYDQTTSQSINTGSLFSLDHASALGTDESFFMMGSDAGTIDTWTESGYSLGYQALDRTWKVEETGVIDEITISIEAADLPALPTGTYGYAIYVDADGDFSSGATTYVLSGATTLTTVGISFSDDEFVKVVAIGNVTEVTGDFSTAATWALNVVPGTTEMAHVTQSHSLTVNSSISVGGIVLDTNATLTFGSGTVQLTDSCIVALQNNTINTGTSTIQYVKTGNQFVTGLDYYSLGVNNSGTKELKGITRVANELELASASSILKTNGLLTLESSASGDASLIEIPTGAQIDGDVIVERYVGASSREWWHMSTPHSDASAADWQSEFPITGEFTGADDILGTNDPSIYTYDETHTDISSDSGWTAFPAANTTEQIAVGTGYRVFLRSTKALSGGHLGDTTINLTGTPNVGDVNLNVTYTSNSDADTAAAGWNFIGNPYACAIDWNAASGWTKTNVADGIYVWDALNQRYTTFVDGVGTHGGTGRIASGQAFWVRSRAVGPVLTATEQVKTTTATTFLKSQSISVENVMHVEIQDGTDKSDLAIRFKEGASPNFESDYDSYYWGGSYPVNLCSYDENDTYYSVNTLPEDHSDDIPLWVQHPSKERVFHLNFSGLSSFVDQPNLYLTDLYLGERVEIYEGMTYEFEYEGSPASNGSSRFVIKRRPSVISGGSEIIEFEEIQVIPNPVNSGDQVQLYLPNIFDDAEVKIFNMSGQLIESIALDMGTTNLSLDGLRKGLYLLTVTDGKVVRSTTLTVK
jgi:hypothetical protein